MFTSPADTGSRPGVNGSDGAARAGVRGCLPRYFGESGTEEGPRVCLARSARAGRDTSSLGRSGAGRGGGGGALRAQTFPCPRGGRGAFPPLRRGRRQCPWLRLAPSPSNHGAVGAVAPVTGRLVSERISKVGICVCVCEVGKRHTPDFPELAMFLQGRLGGRGHCCHRGGF